MKYLSAMMNLNKSQKIHFALGIGITACVFAANMFLPLGAVRGLLYIPLLHFGYLMGRVRWIFAQAAVLTALTEIGYLLSPLPNVGPMELTHRLMVVATLWGVAALLFIILKAQSRLREREAMYRAIMTNAVDGIVTIDTSGIIQSMNVAAEKIFGYRLSEIVGKNVSTLMPSPFAEEHDGHLAKYMATGEKKVVGIGREVTGLRKSDEEFSLDLAVSEIRLASQRLFVGFVRDLTERKKVEDLYKRATHFEQMARTDELTGLFNRRVMTESLATETARATRYSSPLCIQMIDLDHFKKINDTHGHPVGDEVLGRFAKIIAGTVRAADIAARFGGEEFCVLLPGTDAGGGHEFAERTREKLSDETFVGLKGKTFSVTCSIGVAQFRPGDDEPTDLIERADKALYQAKREGRDRTCIA